MKDLPTKIYEHTTDAEIKGDVIDGMDELLGDDISSSDYYEGEAWPGVAAVEIPGALRHPELVSRVID